METAAREKLKKWIATAVIVSASLVLWAVPADVAYLVAQYRDVLLGRYSVGQLSLLLLLVPLDLLVLAVVWAPQAERRKRVFQLLALSVSVVVSMAAVDLVLRIVTPKRYVPRGGLFHRRPNIVRRGVFRDVPWAAFSYPTTPAGYPDVPYTLTVDGRGFRNPTAAKECELLTIGDSYTEAPEVADDQSWPALLAKKSGRTVYNLGMAGADPVNYLEALKQIGLGLRPETVICMVCEANDFRDSAGRKEPGLGDRLRSYRKRSVLLRVLKDTLIRVCGPIGSRRAGPVAEGDPMYAVSWLPLAVPDGPAARHYAFKVKRLLAHFATREALLRSAGCKTCFGALGDMRDLCRAGGIRLIVTYAPDKPHVLLPMVRDRLSGRQVHAFMALKARDLPPPEELIGVLMERLEVHESALAEFCRAESIEFVSPTGPLRRKIAGGAQAYYTYDQHWTPIGQEVTAETVLRYLTEHPNPP